MKRAYLRQGRNDHLIEFEDENYEKLADSGAYKIIDHYNHIPVLKAK